MGGTGAAFAGCSSERFVAGSASLVVNCVVTADYEKLALSLGGGEVSAYHEFSFLSSSSSASCAFVACLNMRRH